MNTRCAVAFIALCLLAGNSVADQGTFADRLVKAALDRTTKSVRYDPAYVSIPYPNGDVPADTGVCTDVVIRSYRALGFDLQKLVHEDMKANFSAYPKDWGLSRTDTNIDHRRVPNLMRWMQRHGKALPVTKVDADYQPGDIVVWWLFYHRYHIGIVSTAKAPGTQRPLITHNIGHGTVDEDVLFSRPILGHYRW